MRLLLDAQLSGRVIGRRLRELGHDVVALDEHRDWEGIDDEEVLGIATGQGRVLITHNIHDFPDILRQWAEDGRQHSGCILLVGIALNDFGSLIRTIEVALADEPSQIAWLDRSAFASRGKPLM